MKQNMEDFINNLLARLDGKIPDDQLEAVAKEMRMCAQDFEVEKKCTEVAVYKGLPDEYRFFMVAKKIEGRSMGTLDLYKMYLEDMFTTIRKPLSQIESNDIRVYLYQLQSTRGISDRTLDCRRLVLNSFFKWCADEAYILKNPCAAISPIRYESKPRQPLNDVEMEKVRRACNTLREKVIIEVFYSTGCRCSELAHLRVEDINFQTREVHLFGKGKKHRTSYLSARALVAIQDYLSTREDNCPYLIRSIKQPYRSLNNGGIENIVKNIGARAGVKDVYPHRIRHTFATDALGHGMDIQELQSLLGHSSVDTTLIYAKINSEQVSMNHHKYVI